MGATVIAEPDAPYVTDPPDRVRALVAAAILDAHDGALDDGRIGDVVLLPHQREAVARIRRSLAEFGGALLADDVGLGKTFVALAVARDVADALVVAPAGLRPVWRDAMRRTGAALPLVSIESLGRRSRREAATPSVRPGDARLVIVDEAHHARNPGTRRYRALAELTSGARVLLLTATPVHNRAAELHALLALFLGARAAHVDDAELARCIVRRRAATLGADGAAVEMPRLPTVLAPRAVHPTRDDGTLERLLALPPPVPPADGGIAAALVALGLVRQWASSVAAVRAALRRRLARTVALAAGVRAGRLPTTAELRRAVVADDAVQLAFPELLATAASDVPALVAALHAHEHAVRATLRTLDDGADDARAECVRRIRRAHPGARVVAFAAYAETVAALFRRLRGDGGVCALGARGATVAGGPLSRREALHRFAPRAHGRAPPSPAHEITLLLATDVISEGVGLQDASVVVHLDLPWTPARLAQRVGRVARIGSPHATIAVHALMPPASAEAWLGAERRLRAKLGEAARLVGTTGTVLPADARARDADARAAAPAAPAEDEEAIRATLRRWRDGASIRAPSACDAACAPVPAPRVAGVIGAAGAEGTLVALIGRPPRLVVRRAGDARPTTRPADVRAALAAAGGTDAVADPSAVREALAALARWQEAASADRALGDVPADAGRTRLLRRIARVESDAPRGRRAAIATAAAAARCAVVTARGAGAERRLAAMLDVGLDDEQWLRAVASVVPPANGFAHTVALDDPERGSEATGPLHAMLVVVAG